MRVQLCKECLDDLFDEIAAMEDKISPGVMSGIVVWLAYLERPHPDQLLTFAITSIRLLLEEDLINFPSKTALKWASSKSFYPLLNRGYIILGEE